MKVTAGMIGTDWADGNIRQDALSGGNGFADI